MKYFVWALFLMLPSIAMAEGDTYLKKGDYEVGFAGSYSNIALNPTGTAQKQSTDFYYADANVSYYLMDNISIGSNVVWLYLPIQGVSARALGLEGNVRYHYQVNEAFIPYIGVHAGALLTKLSAGASSTSDTTREYGAQAGFKIPINNNVYFDSQLKWTAYKLPANAAFDLTTTQVLFGLKIKL